jgi:alkylated DNA repair protein alkB family protein 8
VILKAEQKPLEEVVSKDGRLLLVAHFGNGDEDDQTLINDYCKKFGLVGRITIFPGISYGHVEYSDASSADLLMQDLDGENVKVLSQGNKERHLAFFKTHLQFNQLKNKATVDFPSSVHSTTGVIPGLYVYDNFITEGKLREEPICVEEEAAIVNGLDERQWIKLLNRRVQHYGFEFVYGANNVDSTKHLGDFPDFTGFLTQSKSANHQ